MSLLANFCIISQLSCIHQQHEMRAGEQHRMHGRTRSYLTNSTLFVCDSHRMLLLLRMCVTVLWSSFLWSYVTLLSFVSLIVYSSSYVALIVCYSSFLCALLYSDLRVSDRMLLFFLLIFWSYVTLLTLLWSYVTMLWSYVMKWLRWVGSLKS